MGQKRSILKGALILTIAGFITRFIGFFYRIFLSNKIGAEGMGIYQLIFPIYGICFTLYSAGIQTGISKIVAEQVGIGNYKNAKKILKVGICLSLSIAVPLAVLLYFNSDFVASRILFEKRCSETLKILSVIFPFCAITTCINGYYYGLKKAHVPAATQLLEQIIRVACVYALLSFLDIKDTLEMANMAVIGIVLGEIASNLYNIGSMFVGKPLANTNSSDTKRYKTALKDLFYIATPLTTTRLLVSILQSFEAILIPTMLKKYGLSSQDALAIYGILVGMSMPFIMFPSAITNSLAVMLLPTVSEAQAVNNHTLINKTTNITIKYSILIGILSTGLFIIFGKPLGITIFNNELSGTFLMTLAWLSPFMYLTTTLGSILNGLGKTNITFIHSIIGLLIRIFFIVYCIPIFGIVGYLWGLLASQLVISFLDMLAAKRHIKIRLDAYDWILKPGIIILFCGFLSKHIYAYFESLNQFNSIILVLSSCGVFSIIFLGILFLIGTIGKKDFN